MEDVMNQVITFTTTYGMKVIGAILILIIGRVAAGIVRNLVGKGLERTRIDVSVTAFVKSLSFFLVLTFAVLAALSKFGVQTASFVAVLGAGTFAVGFALQGSLADFAAGVLLLVLRPFKVEDYVEVSGVAGTVKEIQLFSTTLSTPDNVRILIPNGKIYGNIMKNYSANETRRIDLVVGIAYDASLPKALEVVRQLLDEEERILKDPAPVVAISELADSSVNLVIRPWVKTPDYWNTRFDLTRKIKEAFDANGVEIPFPQRVVHMAGQSA